MEVVPGGPLRKWQVCLMQPIPAYLTRLHRRVALVFFCASPQCDITVEAKPGAPHCKPITNPDDIARYRALREPYYERV